MTGMARQTSVQSCDNQFLAPRFFHRFDDARVFPCVNSRAVNRFLVGKNILQLLREESAAVLDYSCEDGRHAKCLGTFGQADGVVQHQCWVDISHVRKLERLVIDENERTVVRRQKGVEPVASRTFFGGGTHIFNPFCFKFVSLFTGTHCHFVPPPRFRPMLCFLARSYFWYELLLPDGTSPSALFRRRRSPRIFQSCGRDFAPHPASAQPAGEGPRRGTGRAASRARPKHGETHRGG